MLRRLRQAGIGPEEDRCSSSGRRMTEAKGSTRTRLAAGIPTSRYSGFSQHSAQYDWIFRPAILSRGGSVGWLARSYTGLTGIKSTKIADTAAHNGTYACLTRGTFACRLKGSLHHLVSTAQEIGRRGRVRMASATRYFSYPSHFSVNNPVSRVTSSP